MTERVDGARDWGEERVRRLPALIASGLVTAGLAVLAVGAFRPCGTPSSRPEPVIVALGSAPRPAPSPPPPSPPLPSPPRRSVMLPASLARIPLPRIRVAAMRPLPARKPAPPRRAQPLPRLASTPAPRLPSPAPENPHATDTLKGRIRLAVQAALRYPESARDLGEQGRALVGFDYRDRSVSNVRILVGSGNGRLDAAALETVREADYPPPGRFAGRTLLLAVWVNFLIGEDG